MIENVLASRYSCDEINSLFTRKKKYSLEREFWISVLKVQIQFGLKGPTEVVTRYEKIKDDIDFESINNRELKLKHDVKARIEEFNELAGQEYIHLGLTSRDVTENIELFQIKIGLTHIQKKSLFLFIIGVY
mgnify:FL=1